MYFTLCLLPFTLYASSLENNVLYPENSLTDVGSIFPFGGTLPTARVFSSIALVKDFLVVFGGYSSDGTVLDDVNLYDLRSHQWSNPILNRQCCNYDGDVLEVLGNPNSDIRLPFVKHGFEGDLPLARAEHISATVYDRMYVFGGNSTDFGLLNDLYYFDPFMVHWTKVSTVYGGVPFRRAGHAAVAYSNGFYIFGGRSEDGYGYHDLWQFDVDILKWTCIHNGGNSESPLSRQHAAMAIMGEQIFIFGGIDPQSNVTMDDLWMFDLASSKWSVLSPMNNPAFGFKPPPLYRSHLVGVPGGLLLYGGVGGGSSCGGPACQPIMKSLGQVYKFSLTEKNWGVGRFYSGGSKMDTNFLSSTGWNFARLTNLNSYKGRLRKLYGLEEMVHIYDRNLVIDIGGLEVIHLDQANDFQRNVDMFAQQQSASLAVGGNMEYGLWDTFTGEQLRSRLETPANVPWAFYEAFTQSQPQLNFTFLKIHRSLRYFTVTDKDLILISSEELSS